MESEPSAGKNCGQAAPYDVPNGSALVEIMAIVGLWCGARDNDTWLGRVNVGDGKCLNDLRSEMKICEGEQHDESATTPFVMP